MAIGAELPVAPGGPVSILSVVEDDPGGFLDPVELHRVNELRLPWKHVGVFAGHVTEIVQVDEYGVREMALVEVDDVVVPSHRAVHDFEVDLGSHLDHLVDPVGVNENWLVELSDGDCCKDC